ncbi:hypothetical protein LIER_01816 [Lithospermum erythrorhizon]|uniref:Uncharacterized protein n=1 Tax=Lithospermum erythrorhizon TaxID=34254 RepID=A0AAV3NRV6_LITER
MVVSDNRPLQPTNLILSDVGHDMRIEALTDFEIPRDVEGAHAVTSVSKSPFGHHKIMANQPLVTNRVKIEVGILSGAQDVYTMDMDTINESGMVNDSNGILPDVERAPLESLVSELYVEIPSIVANNLWVQIYNVKKLLKMKTKLTLKNPMG